MGRYKGYAEYRESGVEWLGNIPASWSLTKMAWNFKAEKGKNGQLLTKEYCGLNPGKYAVYSGQTENDGVMGRIDSFEFDTDEDGVLFSTTVGAKAMHLSHLKGKFSLSQNCMIIAPITECYQVRFSYYHFQPLFAYERGLIPEHMQASFRMEDLYQYPIVLPSLEEQELIASFLDHETAKIDTLISKQERLIELLQEKRQAVISHAVTKGLDASVPMKDSGVEWLGDIPKEWELWKLTHAYEEIGSGTTPPSADAEWYGGTVPWVTTGELREKEIYSTTKNVTDDALRSFTALRKYPKGSIAIAMYGATIGRLGIFGVEATTNQACCVFTKSSVVDNHYLYYWLQAFRQDIVNLASGGGQPNINQEIVASLKVSCPDKVGQEIIVSFLDHETAKIDTLVKKAEEVIELMEERRTALISAAVTGKIDVRDIELQ